MEGGAVSSREHSTYPERIRYGPPSTISPRDIITAPAAEKPSPHITTGRSRCEPTSQEAQQPQPKHPRKRKVAKTAPLSSDELEAANEECELALTPIPVSEEEEGPIWAKLKHGADDTECLLKCKQYFDIVRSVTHAQLRQFNLL